MIVQENCFPYILYSIKWLNFIVFVRYWAMISFSSWDIGHYVYSNYLFVFDKNFESLYITWALLLTHSPTSSKKLEQKLKYLQNVKNFLVDTFLRGFQVTEMSQTWESIFKTFPMISHAHIYWRIFLKPAECAHYTNFNRKSHFLENQAVTGLSTVGRRQFVQSLQLTIGLLFVKTWQRLFAVKTLLLAAVFNKGSTKNPNTMIFLRGTSWLSASINSHLKVHRIVGAVNVESDHVSLLCDSAYLLTYCCVLKSSSSDIFPCCL